MTTVMKRAGFEKLQARINSAPQADRAMLQSQLETIVRSLRLDIPSRKATECADASQDSDVEAMFDNMPV